MANKNGRKGSQFETDVMKWLRSKSVIAERLTKAGAKDEGDMVVIISGETYILELKNRQTLSLPEFWRASQRTNRSGLGNPRLNSMAKGETIMPVPGGEITTTEILVPVVEEVVEDSTTEEEADDSTPE